MSYLEFAVRGRALITLSSPDLLFRSNFAVGMKASVVHSIRDSTRGLRQLYHEFSVTKSSAQECKAFRVNF